LGIAGVSYEFSSFESSTLAILLTLLHYQI